MLRYAFEKQNSKTQHLPVFGCFELKQYLKSKKDAERGNTKLPSDQYRINEMLKPYPDFTLLLDKPNQKKENNSQLLLNVLTNQSSLTDSLHHGGYHRKDIGQYSVPDSEEKFILKDLLDDESEEEKVEDMFSSN